jgi:hypothetical protein
MAAQFGHTVNKYDWPSEADYFSKEWQSFSQIQLSIFPVDYEKSFIGKPEIRSNLLKVQQILILKLEWRKATLSLGLRNQ